MIEHDALTQYTATFVDELARSGTRHAVISPGSRSTPLALLLAEHPDIKIWLQVDERSAAFFALGIAKAAKEPVALLCTSGTAAANYYPAVIEARLSRVPLIVLTADRPHELRDSGAPQAIDQVHLFGKYPKWFVDMALPEQREEVIRYVRISAARAVANATHRPAGPVHINFPFREPLIPNLSAATLWENGQDVVQPFTTVMEGHRVMTDEQLQSLGKLLSTNAKGLIVCGSLDSSHGHDDLLLLAEHLHYPILADPLSQLRTSFGEDSGLIIECYDAFLRVEQFVEHYKPDVIIRFGAMPVSKALTLYLNKYTGCHQIVVDEGSGWRDPTLSATEMIYSELKDLCQRLPSFIQPQNSEVRQAWLSAWLQYNELSRQIIHRESQHETINEGQLMLETISLMEEDALLFVGNSMPIRDLDTFLFTKMKRITTMANRGANGIDGVVSTALGACTQSKQLVLVIGDLSFFHDLNGLLSAKLYDLNITIIVVNNDGGGIFSFLPQADQNVAHFEELFGTPIGVNFEQAVTMYDGEYACVTNWQEFREVYSHSLQSKGLHVIEVVTERKENVQIHRDLWRHVEDGVLRKLENQA